MSVSALGAAREVWDARDGAPTRRDRAYVVYLAVLTILVIGVPGGRVVVEGLARPDVLPLLLARAAGQMVSAAWLLGCALLVLAGGIRGPALLSPFFTATLASSALPRWRALIRPLLRALLALAAAAAILAVLAGATLETAGHAGTGQVASFATAAGGAALLAGSAWALGQVAGARVRRLAAALLTAAAVVVALAPADLGARIGPGAALPPRDGAAWALGLLAAGLGAAVLSVAGLDCLRGEVLLEQAVRWESATMVATSGDVAAASGLFRALPSTGRRLPAVRVPRVPGRLSLPAMYARRDLVALARTPERAISGLGGVLGGSAALAVAAQLTGPAAWALVGLGALVLWGGSGALVDGIRHGISTLGAPTLLGQRAEHQVLLHAITPSAILLLGAVAGGAAGDAVAAGPLGSGLVIPLLLSPVVMIGRVRDAAKGPMPPQLSMPMPTAQGDMSVVRVLAWQADALLLALGTAVAVALGGRLLGVPGLLMAAALAAAVMALGARDRLRALQAG